MAAAIGSPIKQNADFGLVANPRRDALRTVFAVGITAIRREVARQILVSLNVTALA